MFLRFGSLCGAKADRDVAPGAWAVCTDSVPPPARRC
jgi:hypothetical protein